MNTKSSATARTGGNPFWFMNIIFNPIMGIILRSPLQGMLSASMLLITVRGRKSGRAYTLPVQYAQAQNTIYIVPGAPEKKTWWRNLRGGAPVTLRLRGRAAQAQAEVMTGDEAAIVAGLQVYYGRFPAVAGLQHVRRAPDGSFDAGDLQAAARQAVVVAVRLL